MRRFAGYPIVINYNLHTQLRYQGEEDRLHKALQYEAIRQRSIKTITTSDSEIENNLWKQEIDQYEETVYKALQKVEGNPVGRMVLGLINKQTTVWIIPRTDDNLKGCFCAQTGPLNYDIRQQDINVGRGTGFGDTVIDFEPKLGDDTLFHELVHAYRYSYNKFNPMTVDFVGWDRKSKAHSTEEFFAHEMENIYLSQDNRKLTAHYGGWVADKEEIYDFLAKNSGMLQALKSFLRHEYLAMLAAHSFGTSYNPFRDYRVLEAKWLEGAPSVGELPELGAWQQVPRSGPRVLASFLPEDGGPRRNPGPVGIS